jgi:hypothetical protein
VTEIYLEKRCGEQPQWWINTLRRERKKRMLIHIDTSEVKTPLDLRDDATQNVELR